MDKTPTIGENFSTHKPQSGLENTPFLNGHHSSADRARERFKSDLNGERLVVWAEKKTFHGGISAFLTMFTKLQVILTCFDRFLKPTMTSTARGSSKIETNQWRETARDLNAF